MEIDVEALREELPVLARVAYLNTGTFGPLPRRTVEAMVARDERELLGGRVGSAYFEELELLRQALRAAFARLLGAAPASVAVTHATTDGCDLVAAGLGLGRDDEVVTTDVEHPGLTGALHACGARLRVAPVKRARSADEALAAIEKELSPRTRLLALSHVAYSTGLVLPVERLCRRGVPTLIDGAQALGAIPVDVLALGCEFYAAPGQKWLLGPDATGCLYVREDWVDRLRLSFPSTFSFEEEQLAHDRLILRHGAQRFDPGSISPGSLAGMLASIGFAEAAGSERFELLHAAAARCRALLGERYRVVTPPEHAGLVTAEVPASSRVAQYLAGQGVAVRSIPGREWLRASCGYWTNDGDLRRLTGALAEQAERVR